MLGKESPSAFGLLVISVLCSYDLDLDTRLAEETTVLVETYTVPFLRAVPHVTIY
jgi:hypothetical protein